MREQYLQSLISALSDEFLRTRTQSMISFNPKGTQNLSSQKAKTSKYLYQQLDDAGREGLFPNLKDLSFIKNSPFLRNFPYCYFVKINHIMLKRIVYISLFTLLTLPLAAQNEMQKATPADSLYEFCFVAGKDMLYVLYENNRAELEHLRALVRQNYEEIANGSIPVYVDGYCNSLAGEVENKYVAGIRSNRVKSELIVHEKMKETWFITHNYATKGDRVTVKIRVPANPVVVTEKRNTHPPKKDEIQSASEPVRDINPETRGNDTVQNIQSAPNETHIHPTKNRKNNHALTLRANLLHWVTLTPNLGIEWRISPNVGVLVNGLWTSWSWDNKNRRYALWKISPEVRYYIGKEKRGYLGAMYHVGEFNYKPGDTGRQGDYQGGGITGGWQLPLNRALSLDFHVALGYTRAEYDKYSVIDGMRFCTESVVKKDYWGINQLGITLMWKFMK